MQDADGPSLVSRRATWLAATGFWVFVAAMSMAQTFWMSENPMQHVDIRQAMTWQSTYFLSWIPLTLAIWHVSGRWLPERFGGWPRFLLAHLPVLVTAAFLHPLLMNLLQRAVAARMGTLVESYLTELRGQLTASPLIY